MKCYNVYFYLWMYNYSWPVLNHHATKNKLVKTVGPIFTSVCITINLINYKVRLYNITEHNRLHICAKKISFRFYNLEYIATCDPHNLFYLITSTVWHSILYFL